MREILARKRDIAAAVGAFRRAVAAIAPAPRKLAWTFPSGERLNVTTYTLTARRARLFVGLPARAAGSIVHLFHLGLDETALTPDAELTVPMRLDRKQSGVYVRNVGSERGGAAPLLATRGSFSSRGKIARGRVFRHFDKWLLRARDGKDQTRVIPVAAADSPVLAEDLYTFVEAVILLKNALRDGEPDDAFAWREPAEGDAIAASEHMHGLMAHALEMRLKELTHMSARHKVCRNCELDLALVDTKRDRAVALFEVETALRPDARLHAAVGRLLHFRTRYGDAATRLLLAIPVEEKSHVLDLQAFFFADGIEVIVRTGADFHGLDGVPLAQLLDRTLAG